MNIEDINDESTSTELWIDGHEFEATGFREFEVETVEGCKRRVFAFDFKVTHQQYHDVATLLYKGTFRLRVPAAGVDLETDIHNYSTSLDNLYEEGAVGDYHLELAERQMNTGG
ncbi:DUF3219 family protein [Saccharibacillus kuerlensis]|uniref:DUF3219 domain-containing protein n=1 Tax=Saccharibacillus kuerlensis TaxID=459527 RepID=A0ABQ2L3U6_9BACL|nr:DUF3219 family protein [Saccharibacillus kuerlensis]GGO01281.1 hypothetical protein GCM10010969_23430 [Saccharibacillus kuerlensis]